MNCDAGRNSATTVFGKMMIATNIAVKKNNKGSINSKNMYTATIVSVQLTITFCTNTPPLSTY